MALLLSHVVLIFKCFTTGLLPSTHQGCQYKTQARHTTASPKWKLSSRTPLTEDFQMEDLVLMVTWIAVTGGLVHLGLL